MSHRVSDRGEQMKHRSKNLHERHMSDIRGAVGCYYCWLGQYSKCKNSCHLVRVTDRDHSMAQSGGAADHRDVLYRWDHAAPVLTHAAQQSNSFYNIPAPKEASVWVNSASGMGKQHLTKNDFISVTRHVPEDKPWITSSRADQNRSMLKSISQNIHQAEIDRAERHRAKHEHKLFSLLLPEQFIPPYKYPHGSVTVQATPYTQIAMKQPRNKNNNNNNSTRARSSSPNTTYNRELNNSYRAAGGNVMYSFNDDYIEQIEDARTAATEQRRQTQAMLRGANRPVFMHTRHGGRYVTADSSIYNGGEVLRKGATSDDTPAKQLRRAEEDFIAAQNYGTHNASHVLSTAEQLRAALEGRSITQMRDDRVVALRARSAGVGHRERGLGGGTRNEPSVRMEETSGHVLSGRYTNAMTMPMPESFAF